MGTFYHNIPVVFLYKKGKVWIFLIVVSRIVFQFFDVRVDGGHPKVYLTFITDKFKKIIQSFSQTKAKWW
jgi:hypothetical protein